jgi:hypothetical protein
MGFGDIKSRSVKFGFTAGGGLHRQIGLIKLAQELRACRIDRSCGQRDLPLA